MSAPDRISAPDIAVYSTEDGLEAAGRYSPTTTPVEYVRLDPAVLAALSEVKALIDAERERCAKVADESHAKAIEWAKTVRGLEKHIDETDSSRIAATIRKGADHE